MINHVSLGVSDIARSKVFFDAVLAPLDYRCLSQGGDMLGYGRQSPALWLLRVSRPVAAQSQPGLHICFDAPTRATVDAFHRAALASGGADNGAPGLRLDYGPDYYAAFVIDPDGHRLEAYCPTA